MRWLFYSLKWTVLAFSCWLLAFSQLLTAKGQKNQTAENST
jgi:hypothetical protein